MIEVLVLLYIVLRVWAQMNESKTKLRRHKYMLIVAHTDDESMFFGPFISRVLSQGKRGPKKAPPLVRRVTVAGQPKNLPLSILGQDGPGTEKNEDEVPLVIIVCTDGARGGEKEEREKEMRELGESIEVPVYFLEEADGDLKASNCLVERLKRIYLATGCSKIVTFDRHGVSHHPDHQECYTIGKLLCKKVRSNSFYTLATYSLLGKYWYGMFDRENKLVISNSITESIECRSRLARHKSQMLWFRYLYLLFSTYMDINILQLKVLH